MIIMDRELIIIVNSRDQLGQSSSCGTIILKFDVQPFGIQFSTAPATVHYTANLRSRLSS